MNNENWWTEIDGKEISQGDFLANCPVPIVPDSFDPTLEEVGLTIEERDVIIITQSCDLFNNKANLVALCPVYSLIEMELKIPRYTEKNAWEAVRQGRNEGLHMISSFNGPDQNKSSMVVDFRQIYSLPIAFLRNFAAKAGLRKRLNSPYLEHLAQSFARFFMRVGLPSSIKPFK